ncbi:hypothetical protein ASD11_12125 [Aeromicrobium sp. Root495]|uniref:BTAD domain-containing putative transcriptional regulator n=1 Tax=Aeromicrobium sp. Root495 TaxID=1736550 RepID=UPI0006FC870B|nr:BTAD domain-containing putative transcriptional regulator [Aeromicrobium sp. Root495]KQY60209.1 hypothetical protein ASD11_12125 [Aeromicrobium sp. Root495]
MRVEVLGPVRVLADGREIDLGGARNRALVGRLALADGRAVPASTLIDDLWGDDLPADAANALQSVVSRTRRRLPDGALVSTASGYVLSTSSTDVGDLRRGIAEGDGAAAALWRGEPFADAGGPPFVDDVLSSLAESRLLAVELDVAERLRSGPTSALVTELAVLTQDHPYREDLWRLRLEALAASGRPAEALDAYDELRRRLADDLGTDPSPALQDMHTRLLRGEVGQVRHHAARLPVALTSFVGRDQAVHDLRAALRSHRLVTILGPGGAGKTRLSIESARGSGDVWLVELASVASEADVVRTTLGALDLVEVATLDGRRRGATDDRSRLLEGAADLHGLVVLDNCEHVIDAAARLVDDLLSRAPGLRVLATSREPLRLIGELVHPIEPLAVPEQGVPVEDALEFSAVRLFVERAQAADPSFVLDADTLPAVLDVGRRLDGQPLALELAAARLRTSSVQQVAARLGDRFRLLTGGSRTALPRHRTLRAVVEWSWDLLEPEERDLAERLAVFPAGVTAAGAAAVGGIDEVDAADLLASLADKSLLTPVRGEGEPRFRMLETLREFGTERLVEAGTVTSVRRAHLAHVVAMLQHHGPLLRGPEQLRSLEVIDVEWGNVAAALRFAIDVHDRAGAGQILQVAAWYWAMRGQEDEFGAWIGEVMALPPSDDPVSEMLLHGLAIVGEMSRTGRSTSADEHVAAILAAYDTGRAHGHWADIVIHVLAWFGRSGDRMLPEPTDLWTRSVIAIMGVVLSDNAGTGPADRERLLAAVEGFREVGDRSGLASALTSLGTEHALDGHLDEAVATWREAQGLLEQLGAGEDLSFVRSRIVGVRLVTAGRDDLQALREELLREEARVSHERGRWILRATLAEIEVLAGRPEEAVRMLEEQAAEDGGAALGSSQARAALLGFLARARVAAGRLDDAQEAIREGFEQGERVEDMPILAGVARAVAHLTRARGDAALAARQLGASDQLRGRQDLSVRDGLDLAAGLREELGLDRFERELEAGRSLPRDEALALVRPA